MQAIKTLRLVRKTNRGLYINTSTGFSSRNRRDVINRAIALAPCNTASIVRRRLRRGWTLTDALTTQACTGDGSQVVNNLPFSSVGLIHYWTMDETTGSRQPSVGSEILSESGGPITNAAGKDSNAASFSSGLFLEAQSFLLNLTRPYSLAFWAYIATNSSLTHIVQHSLGMRVQIATTGVVTFLAQESSVPSYVTTPSVFGYAVWNLLVLTVDSSGIARASLNGETFNVSAGPANSPGTGEFRIGNYVGTSATRVDEFAIYDRALSQSEAASLWNDGTGRFL